MTTETPNLDVEGILTESARRTVARNGVILILLLSLPTIVSEVFGVYAFFIDVLVSLLDTTVTPSPDIGGLLGSVIGGGVSVVILIAGIVYYLAILMAALRIFCTDNTQTIPREAFRRNLPFALINLFIGLIIFSLSFAIGLFLLILPGIFLAVSLWFWDIFVVVEDRHLIESFKSSWRIAEGNRLMLFVIGFLVSLIIGTIDTIAGFLGIVPVAGAIVESVITSGTLLFIYAASARTYVHLTGDRIHK